MRCSSRWPATAVPAVGALNGRSGPSENFMVMRSRLRGRTGLTVLCAVLLGALPGCSKAVKRVPVSGTVTLDGKPLGVGVVSFAPDAEKGNTNRVACIGRANSGKY